MCDHVGAVVSQHKFGDSCFAFAFVIVAAIFSREHDTVADLVDMLRCPVLIGVVCLVDFGGEEVVLCLLNV